jgi:arylsulfatase
MDRAIPYTAPYPASIGYHPGRNALIAIAMDSTGQITGGQCTETVDAGYRAVVQPFDVARQRADGLDLRDDPFERTPSIRGESLNSMGGGYMNDFYAREFWRFVLVQQEVAQLAQTAIEYPPMQAPASFNLEAVKAQVDEMIRNHAGQ